MKNFMRALRFAWPYRTRLAISIFCALLAAALWSLNFTAIYPILKIFSTGQNLQAWVNASIKTIQEEQINKKDKEIAELRQKLNNSPKIEDEKERATVERHLNTDI